MPGAAHKLDQGFWQPPSPAASSEVPAEVCPNCNTEFAVGARFCHVCGAQREDRPGTSSSGSSQVRDFRTIRDSLGLTIASLLALIAGVVCILIAAGIGLMYTATTTLDWQAIQMWRIQWLLAAIAAFVAGILLKRVA